MCVRPRPSRTSSGPLVVQCYLVRPLSDYQDDLTNPILNLIRGATLAIVSGFRWRDVDRSMGGSVDESEQWRIVFTSPSCARSCDYTFKNFGKPARIVLELHRLGKESRIADVEWNSGPLRGLYRPRAAYDERSADPAGLVMSPRWRRPSPTDVLNDPFW
jgi:hypothetical protein